jgi:hypothetical protein
VGVDLGGGGIIRNMKDVLAQPLFVCVLRAGSPEGPERKYTNPPRPNAATSAVPAISFRPEAKLVRSADKSACS